VDDSPPARAWLVPAPYADLPRQTLGIGEGLVCPQPAVVYTVLGSCVSVTFFHPPRRLGGIFHALLPRADSPAAASQDPYRHVDSAVATLWRRLRGLGAQPLSTQCKVFGGANALTTADAHFGQTNALAAFEALATLGLRVVASQVGGPSGYRLVFVSHTGEVYVQPLR
jgi:chemotaxis protein CheD